MSNKSVGEVLELFVSVKGESRRIAKSFIELDENGVKGDKFYSKDRERSVLLTTIDSYKIALSNGIEISYGTLGENILIDFNPYSLPIGKKIQIGEVILELSQNCTICNHLSIVDKSLPKLLKDDRGVFIKVVKSGIINKGDKVYLKQEFKEIEAEDDLKNFIKVVFNADLNVSGAWGYSKELATVIEQSNNGSIAQVEFTLATMRAYLEMNMTLDEDERYGAINLNELSRVVDGKYEKVTYEVSAIKELEYKKFIDEYKEKSEYPDFDMTEHFNRRKEATLKREVIHWFYLE